MTTERLHILGIAGSLRQGSFNKALLRAASDLLPPGATLEIYDRLGDIPLYNEDVERRGDPEPVRDLKDRITSADALLIATPEYNYGTPGVLKNAIDWASRPPAQTCLKGKPTAIMGASSGAHGTARAQAALRLSLVFTRTLILVDPEVYVSKASEKFDVQGRLTDELTREFVRKLLVALVDWSHTLRRAAAPAMAA